MTEANPAGHVARLTAATLIVAADYACAASSVSYPYRFLAIVALTVVLRRIVRIEGWPPRLGAIASLRLVAKFTLWFLAIAIPILAISVVAIRLGGWRFAVTPQNVRTIDAFGEFVMHAVVWAPIVEETIYRGALHPYLRESLGRWPSIAIGALVFWVLHWIYFGHVTFPNHLFGGWVFAWSYDRTRSLLAPVLLHAFGNLLVGLCDVAWLRWQATIEQVLGWS